MNLNPVLYKTTFNKLISYSHYIHNKNYLHKNQTDLGLHSAIRRETLKVTPSYTSISYTSTRTTIYSSMMLIQSRAVASITARARCFRAHLAGPGLTARRAGRTLNLPGTGSRPRCLAASLASWPRCLAAQLASSPATQPRSPRRLLPSLAASLAASSSPRRLAALPPCYYRLNAVLNTGTQMYNISTLMYRIICNLIDPSKNISSIMNI